MLAIGNGRGGSKSVSRVMAFMRGLRTRRSAPEYFSGMTINGHNIELMLLLRRRVTASTWSATIGSSTSGAAFGLTSSATTKTGSHSRALFIIELAVPVLIKSFQDFLSIESASATGDRVRAQA